MTQTVHRDRQLTTDPEPTLWPQPDIDPCLRIPFRVILSQNDLVGEKWQKTQVIEKWRLRGEARFIEVMKASGHQIEGYHDTIEYKYRGKAKAKIKAGNRLKEYLFNEPIIIICRVWTSDNGRIDIDNIHLKAVIDGFVDGHMIPDDDSRFIRGIFRWFEGIDHTAGMSADEKRRRSNQLAIWKAAGIKRQNEPPPNKRIWIDCYRISRLVENKIDLFSLIGFPRLTL